MTFLNSCIFTAPVHRFERQSFLADKLWPYGNSGSLTFADVFAQQRTEGTQWRRYEGRTQHQELVGEPGELREAHGNSSWKLGMALSET